LGTLTKEKINQLVKESLFQAFPYKAREYYEDRCSRVYPDPADAPPSPPSNTKRCTYYFFDSRENELWGGGAWANWQKDGTRADYEEYIAPLDNGLGNEVQIAGSASCFRYIEFMHGGYCSGVLAGDRVLDRLGVPSSLRPNTPCTCDVEPVSIGNYRIPKGV